ncbi:MAG: hypothetical protein Q7R32_00195 [Dehalococcoidia bacterium]|nr:hypothetical protein [Dehalococcoidia bacterium]
MTEKLLMKNLPACIGEAELLALLSPICEATVLSGPEGEGVNRQATIEVAGHDEAGRIVQGLDGRIVDGQQINVEWGRPQELGVRWELQSESEIPERPEPSQPPERPHRPERSPGR